MGEPRSYKFPLSYKAAHGYKLDNFDLIPYNHHTRHRQDDGCFDVDNLRDKARLPNRKLILLSYHPFRLVKMGYLIIPSSVNSDLMNGLIFSIIRSRSSARFA